MIRLLAVSVALTFTTLASAQQVAYPGLANSYVPFSQRSPSGAIGRTFTTVNPSLRGMLQTVQWDVPGDATVTTYAGGRSVDLAGTEPIAVEVGHLHRFRVSFNDGLRQQDLFPSVELIDRLHPPEGRDAEFPVILELTDRDIEAYREGQMVTKVVYVQPRNADYISPILTRLPTTLLPLDGNVIKEAILRGRPIAIVRLGGREPMPGETDGAFFGSGGRVVAPLPADGLSQRLPPTVCGPGEKQPTNSELFPDEYLCDGGDTGVPSPGPIVSPLDLAFEETVATHIDLNDNLKTTASTRVCLYAPAFGVVTSVSGGIVDVAVLQPAGAHKTRMTQRFDITESLVTNNANVTGEGIRIRERLSAMAAEQTDANEVRIASADLQQQVVGAFADFGFNTPIEQTKREAAIIGERIAASVAYSDGRSPVIVGVNENLGEEIGVELAGVMTEYDDRRPEGNLVLAKLADKTGANVGETVTFTIRYDNIGGRPIREVTLSDHLSPRLRYVPDSAESSLPADIEAIDDGHGSVLLQVRLRQPLAAKSGGTLTFETVVR